MGAAIAAHAANAGLAVELLDLDQEAIQGGFERMLAARPAALASPRLAERIRLGTFEEDLDRVGDADWVVEAIVERLEPKQELLARVEKLVDPDAVVTSNTSGLPLASLAEGRSEAFRRRFLGTHFFNPPRYLKLVELIPTADTDPEVLERMRAFVERVLGKGAVVAKDTPNFIANRLGSFAGMHDVRYALEHGYAIEEVDALVPRILDAGVEVLAVTGDHSTPAQMAAHSWHPVPVLLWGGTAAADGLPGFDEVTCRQGSLGRFEAKHLLPQLLAAAGRLTKYGA